MRRTNLFLISGILPILLIFHADAGATTWYVTADGTGDAPDIQAAFDSSTAGDTILVGEGTFMFHGNDIYVPAGVALASENGATRTTLLPSEGRSAVVGLANDASLIGFWVRGLQVSIQIAVAAQSNATVAYNVIESSGLDGIQIFSGEVHHNLIMGPGPIGVFAAFNAIDVNLHHNIILNGVDCSSGGFFSLCNNVLGTIDCSLDGSSFSLDPQFCGVDNYYLQSDSPCAPGNHPDGLACGQIGPFPVGCGTVDTREQSWGVVKSLYQSE